MNEDMYIEQAMIRAKGLQSRLTLGFNHPGVLASHLTTVMLSSFKGFRISVLFLLTIVIVYMTNAQNPLLALSIMFFSGVIWRYFRTTVVLSLLSSIGLFLFYGQDRIDQLMSGRLTLWGLHLVHNLKGNLALFGTGPGNAVRLNLDSSFFSNMSIESYFHVDNYWVEVLIEDGVIGVCLLLLFVVRGLYLFRSKNMVNAFILLLIVVIYSVFDSAFISTGSVFSVLVWLSIVNHSFYTKYD